MEISILYHKHATITSAAMYQILISTHSQVKHKTWRILLKASTQLPHCPLLLTSPVYKHFQEKLCFFINHLPIQLIWDFIRKCTLPLAHVQNFITLILHLIHYVLCLTQTNACMSMLPEDMPVWVHGQTSTTRHKCLLSSLIWQGNSAELQTKTENSPCY